MHGVRAIVAALAERGGAINDRAYSGPPHPAAARLPSPRFLGRRDSVKSAQ